MSAVGAYDLARLVKGMADRYGDAEREATHAAHAFWQATYVDAPDQAAERQAEREKLIRATDRRYKALLRLIGALRDLAVSGGGSC